MPAFKKRGENVSTDKNVKPSKNSSPDPPLPSSATPSPEPAWRNSCVSPARKTFKPEGPMLNVSMSMPGWGPLPLLSLPFITLPGRLAASLSFLNVGLPLVRT